MFIVCGEALFDVYLEQDYAGAKKIPRHLSLQAHVGGSPLNVAVGMARLGQASALLTGLSHDFLGDHLHAVLQEEGVSTRFICRKTAPTTLSFIQQDAAGVPSYAFYGNAAADRVLTPEDLANFDFTEISGVHLGSYSMVVQPAADAYLKLLKSQAGGGLVSLDPNVRLNVEPNLDIWRKRLDELLPLLNVLKLSDEDLHYLYPEHQPEEIIQRWQQVHDIQLLALTRGSQGATLWSKQAHVNIKAPSVAVVDTVGAGDTFQAALLDGLLRSGIWPNSEAQLRDLGTFAVTAAAITCSRRGADLPSRKEIMAQLAQKH